jgi:magnesium transporter
VCVRLAVQSSKGNWAVTTKRRSQKAGLPPGALIHIGDKKVDKPRISFIEFDEFHLNETQLSTVTDWKPVSDGKTVTWLDIGGLHQVGLIEQIGQYFHLHPLVLEDILNTDQRAKLDGYPDYTYVVLKMLYSADSADQVISEQVSIILGRDYVLTFQENGKDVFDSLRTRLRTDKGQIRKRGADYVGYALIDAIVDHYFIIMERLGERIGTLEDKCVLDAKNVSLGHILQLKKDMRYLRRAVWPLREVISGLQREDNALVRPATKPYLHDIYDHTVQIMETIESFHDQIAGMQDIYMSSNSQRMAAVMKVLTIITTIFMPLTFIAGIYGMNFEHMPELKSPWGYPIVLAVMAFIGITMVVFFRRKKWL